MQSLYLKLKVLSKKLSVRAFSFVAIAIIACLVATKATIFVPDSMAELLGSSAVDDILKIMASSMLAVVAFSLTTTISAFNSASQGVTPRAAQLLIEDQGSQNALSIFLGAFIFSILSIVALSTGYYDEKGKASLLVFTILLISIVVITMIGWIEKLSKLGRVHETILKLENVTKDAITQACKDPFFKCSEYDDNIDQKQPFTLNTCGYLQWVDYDKLNDIISEKNGQFYLESQIGSLIGKDSHIGYLKNCQITKELQSDLESCFVTSKRRSFENDVRFGFVVLAEVASRALSPAINDPGTAIEVIASSHRLLYCWDNQKTQREIKRKNIFVRPVSVADLFDDLFHPLSRDGSGHYEVVNRMLNILSSFMKCGNKDLQKASQKYFQLVYKRAEKSLQFDEDKELLKSKFSSLL